MNLDTLVNTVSVELGGILSNKDIADSISRMKMKYFDLPEDHVLDYRQLLDDVLVELLEYRSLHLGIASVARLEELGKDFDVSRVAAINWTTAEHETVVSFDLLCPNGKSLHFIVHPLHDPSVAEIAIRIKEACEAAPHVRVIETHLV